MDWSKGFSIAYRVCTVDPVTWADGNRFDILDGEINREATGLRQSADLTCDRYGYGSDEWIRVWADVKQGGSAEHIPLFTGLASVPEENIEGTLSTVELECYSVLEPARKPLPIGWYASKRSAAGEVIKSLLEVTPAPVHIERNSPRLSEHIIAEEDETHLSMVEAILDSIGWRMFIDGDGTIRVEPEEATPVKTFGALANDMLDPKVNRKSDYFECPNVFRAVSDGDTVVVYDDDPRSPFSIAARGREIWKGESGVKLADDESLLQYARRKLKEAQGVGESISYSRAYDPKVNVSDVIALDYPKQGLAGNYIVKSQRITLDHKMTTSEEVNTIE